MQRRPRVLLLLAISHAPRMLSKFSPQKGGFLRDAAAEGIALVFPDTSPRGAGVQGEDDDWAFGTGTSAHAELMHVLYIYLFNLQALDFISMRRRPNIQNTTICTHTSLLRFLTF